MAKWRNIRISVRIHGRVFVGWPAVRMPTKIWGEKKRLISPNKKTGNRAVKQEIKYKLENSARPVWQTGHFESQSFPIGKENEKSV